MGDHLGIGAVQPTQNIPRLRAPVRAMGLRDLPLAAPNPVLKWQLWS